MLSNLWKESRLVRAIWSKTDTARRRRPQPLQARLAGSLLLVLCISLTGGCATTRTATVATQPSLVATASSFFHTTVETFDRTFTLTLTILPGHTGTNRFNIQIADHTGRPAEHVKMTLYTTMQDMSMGTDSVVLHPDGPGQFSATSDVLNMGGRWAIGIAVQTADQRIHKAGVMLAIPL